MPSDVRDSLRRSAAQPSRPLDVADLWRKGRRRWWTRVAASAAVLVVTAAGVGAASGITGDWLRGVGPAGNGGQQAEDGRRERCAWSLGTMGALDGEFAYLGHPIAQAVELAVTEANREGEIACSLRLKKSNTEGFPDNAPRSARKLVRQGIVACICPYFSGETLASGALFSDAGVAFVTPAVHSTIDDQGFQTFFRAVPEDLAEGRTAAAYVEQALGAESVAVVHDNQDYSKQVTDVFIEEANGRVRMDGPYIINPDRRDYSAVVRQIEKSDPDVVYYGGYWPQAGDLVRQMRGAEIGATFVSGSGVKDTRFAERARDAAPGTIVTCVCADPAAIPEARNFVASYERRFGEAPGSYFATEAYDATRIVIRALAQLNGDEPLKQVRRHVVRYLDKAREAQGLAKTYSWDRDGEFETDELHDIWIYEWSDQEERFVALGRASDLI